MNREGRWEMGNGNGNGNGQWANLAARSWGISAWASV